MTVSPHYHLCPKTLEENLEWRADLLRMAAKDKRLQRDLKRMCSEDILFFCNFAGWVIEPRPKMSDSRILPFITYDFQDEAILDIDAAIGQHDLAIKKSRDMGASWMILYVFFHRWMFRHYESFLVVSRNEEYVDAPGNPKALFWKLDKILELLPPWLKPIGYSPRLHRRGKHLENPETGTVIDGETTTDDVGAGDRRTAILLDEFARFDPKDSYRVMSSTISTTDCRIFNSTFKGTGNAFADVIEKGDIKTLWIPWYRHPKKKIGLYPSDGKQRAPDHKGKLRSPWYDNECLRAIHPFEIQQEVDGDAQNSNANFFDTQVLNERIKLDTMEPFSIGELRFDLQSLTPEEYSPQQGGRLRLWINPDPYGKIPIHRMFSMGADIAVGTGASNSCLMVYDKSTGEKVAEYVDSRTDPVQLGKYAVALCRWFNDAFLVPEANGPGQTFIKTVLEHGYSNIYFRQQEDRIDRPSTMYPGWWAGKEEKGHLFAEYRSALRDGLVINRSKPALEECKEIAFTPDGSVEHSKERGGLDPSGAKFNHGDRPTADALAWRGCRENVTRRIEEKVDIPREIPIGCLAWRMDQDRAERERADELVW